MPPGTSMPCISGRYCALHSTCSAGIMPALQDLLVVVDVVDERIERAHALLEAALEPRPLVDRQDARHDVEGDQPLGAFVLAVHGERDADAMEQRVGLGALVRQPLGGLVVEPLGIAR